MRDCRPPEFSGQNRFFTTSSSGCKDFSNRFITGAITRYRAYSTAVHAANTSKTIAIDQTMKLPDVTCFATWIA